MLCLDICVANWNVVLNIYIFLKKMTTNFIIDWLIGLCLFFFFFFGCEELKVVRAKVREKKVRQILLLFFFLFFSCLYFVIIIITINKYITKSLIHSFLYWYTRPFLFYNCFFFLGYIILLLQIILSNATRQQWSTLDLIKGYC